METTPINHLERVKEPESKSWNTHVRLDDKQWKRISAALRGRVKARARNGGNTREFVEMVLWIAHTQARWADLPVKPHTSWHAFYVRFCRWADDGHWNSVIDAIPDLPDSAQLLLEMLLKRLHARRISSLRKRMKRREGFDHRE